MKTKMIKIDGLFYNSYLPNTMKYEDYLKDSFTIYVRADQVIGINPSFSFTVENTPTFCISCKNSSMNGIVTIESLPSILRKIKKAGMKIID